MDPAGVHQHEAEQSQPRHDDDYEEALHRYPMPGEKPADHRPHIRKDADQPDADEIEVWRADEAAGDIDGGGRDEGDGGDAKHGRMKVNGNPLVFSHTAPNTTRIQAPSSEPRSARI